MAQTYTETPQPDAFPMPEGYMARLQTKAFTKNDLAWQAKAHLDDPSVREVKLASTVKTHEKMAHDARKELERAQIKRGVTRPTTGDIGSLTARDLPCGQAPAPLIAPFLTRDEGTLIYAKGGTGKGLLACWQIMELVRLGHIIMIYDGEGHRREWGSRLRAMGLTDEELGHIHYRSPSSDEWKAAGVTLPETQDLIKADCDALGVTVLIIDSYTYAAATGAEMGGAGPAAEFWDALKRIGRTSVVLAHNTGAATRFPDRPFGSVHVKNGSREAWAVEKVEGEQIEFDHDTNPLQPRVVALEARCTKMSERDDTVPPQFITFSFFHDGHIEVTRPEKAKQNLADIIIEALGSTARTVKQIVAAIKEDTGQTRSTDTVETTLKRLKQDNRVTHATDVRPREWSAVR